MKTRLAVLFSLFCASFLCISCASFVRPTDIKSEFRASSAVLQVQSLETNRGNLCTAVAFAKNGKKYQFFTAAHCVAKYEEETGATFLKHAELILILERQNGDLMLLEAKVLAVGEKENFEDLAVLEAESDEDIPLVPLAKSGPEFDEDVRVVSGPLGARVGLLSIRGYVSKEKPNNLEKTLTLKTQSAFIVQLLGFGKGQGISGGGILSVKRGEIIGVVVSMAENDKGHISFLANSILRFNDFYKEFLEGKRLLPEYEEVVPEKEGLAPEKKE